MSREILRTLRRRRRREVVSRPVRASFSVARLLLGLRHMLPTTFASFASFASLAALESKDERRLAAELGLSRLRTQAAAIRSVADHAERLARAVDVAGLDAQLVEEMARLGCLLLEAAGSLARLPGQSDGAFLARCAAPPVRPPLGARASGRP